MNRPVFKICAFLLIAPLAACVDRADADAQLRNGCIAGVNVLLDKNGDSIGKVVKADFSPSPEGTDMRHVALTATLKDDWSETENEYSCIFQESFGFMNASYAASIYQVRTPDATIGKVGGTIEGDAEDFMRLNDAIRDAMYR